MNPVSPSSQFSPVWANPFLLLALEYLLGLVFVIFFTGMFVGIFTYRNSGRGSRRGREYGIDLIFEIGVSFTHFLIGYFFGSKKSSWLDDTQLMAMLRGMDPNEFEKFVAEMFTALGYRTKRVGGSGDGGVDIAMVKDGRHYLVQCKKFITRKVNPHDVRDFYGAMGNWHIDGKGFFVTTNIFTLEAENFAEGKPMDLIDGSRLIGLVRKSGVLGESQPKSRVKPKVSDEACPLCGGVLMTRKNHKDGSEFIGCSNFPKCRFTKAL